MKIPIWIKSEYVTYIGISTFHSGRCWTSATGTQQPSVEGLTAYRFDSTHIFIISSSQSAFNNKFTLFGYIIVFLFGCILRSTLILKLSLSTTIRSPQQFLPPAQKSSAFLKAPIQITQPLLSSADTNTPSKFCYHPPSPL